MPRTNHEAIAELSHLERCIRVARRALAAVPVDYATAQREIAIVLAAQAHLRAIFDDIMAAPRPATKSDGEKARDR